MKHSILTIATLFLAFCGVLFLCTGSALADETIEARLISQAADTYNVAWDNLVIANLDLHTFPVTGVSLYFAKVLDNTTQEVYQSVLDLNGNPANWDEAVQAERDAHRARYGKLEPKLYDLLADQPDDSLVTVGIWLKGEVTARLERPLVPELVIQDGQAELPEPLIDDESKGEAVEKSPEEIAAWEAGLAELALPTSEQQAEKASSDLMYQQYLASVSDEIAMIQQPLLEALQAMGHTPIYSSLYAPLVYVELPKSSIIELSQRTDVDTIYGPNEYHDALDSARPTQKQNVVYFWGYTGTGIKVSILEDNRIEFTNPYIPDGITRDFAGGTVDQHVCATSGIVASTHSTYTGMAPGVSLYSANAPGYTDANLSAAMDWSVAQGVNVINNSWGGDDGTGNLNVHDRHLDYIVRNSWKTVTVAAGNTDAGCGGSGRVTSPARGFNVISVGNYYDANTLTWTGDGMDSCSSYIDPSTGVGKPELSAVGSNINSTTNVNPWVGDVGSGTSYSSPMIAGEAAAIMQNQGYLTSWPEPMKAILMAAALHNIEGVSGYSDRDGAGGEDMRAAFKLANSGWYAGAQANTNSFPLIYSFYAYQGELVRVVSAWDSNPSGDYTTDPLQADLDLNVDYPGGGGTGSWSSINPYELVEFTAPSTGTYTIRVTKWSFNGTSEYVGTAFWVGHRVLTSYTPQSWSTPAVSRDNYRQTPTNYYWNVVGIRSPAAGDYEIALYNNSPFGNPANVTWLEDSTTTLKVDFMVVDNNHAPVQSYYPEVYTFSGTGNYAIEWAANNSSISNGIYGPFTIASNEVVRVWDAYLSNGVRKYIRIHPTSGNADLGLALMQSNPATPTTFYQGRSTAVIDADSYGAGADETMNYLPSATDYFGLVAFNNGSTTDTSYYLYADETAPTGSLNINSSATYTTSTSVTLTSSASDPETGMYLMRFSNDGVNWSAWEAYLSTKAWTLLGVDGVKTVYVQYQNNAAMTSSTYTDTIILDATAPSGSVSINAGAAYTTSTSVTLTLSASDATSGMYQMRFSNDGSGWSTWETYGASKSWALSTGDGSKTVYVQYKDNAGNTSGSFTDTITYDATAPSGTISINAGAIYTTSTTVTLTLSGTDATSGMYQMRFSNDGSGWSAWEAYSTSKASTLTSGDGAKTVYVQYKDNAGNTSGSFTDGIILDGTAPTGTISVNSGATYTTSISVTLALSATDGGSGMYQMRFSNDNSGWSTWESYGTTKVWTLSSGDGAKTVYVQYKDNAGNTSGSYSDGITYDATAPAGTISINSGAAYTTSMAVTVTNSVSDATSGMYQMRFSNDNSTWSTWETYNATKSWTLTAGDGAKTVYAQFKDNAGNTSSSITDGISLDMNGPTGTVTINSGATYTTTTAVTLGLSANDAGSSVAVMRFSNDGSSWSSWETYSTSKGWTLSAANGTKTVYVQYKDVNNNISDTVTDTIILDNTPPTASVYAPAHTFDLSFIVNWSGADNATGIANYDIQYRVNSGGVWTNWLTGVTTTSATFGPGAPVGVTRGMVIYFRVRARDGAGNVSSYAGGDGDAFTVIAFPIYLPGIMR